MEDGEKSSLARIIETAGGMLALIAVVVLSGYAGESAYLVFGPSAQEAQAIRTVLQQRPAPSASIPPAAFFSATTSAATE